MLVADRVNIPVSALYVSVGMAEPDIFPLPVVPPPEFVLIVTPDIAIIKFWAFNAL